MPVYVYECQKCGNKAEVMQKINEIKLTEGNCLNCNTLTPWKRIITTSNFHLKGSGWSKDGYVTNKETVESLM